MTNTTRRITLKQVKQASSCRRHQDRQKLAPSVITCWGQGQRPVPVSSIEIDSRGARLVLPWDAATGESVQVSLADNLGQFRTTTARVVWTQSLPNATKTIAGLAFDEEVLLAA